MADPTKLVLPWNRIPPKWTPETAREINEDLQALTNAVNALSSKVDTLPTTTSTGTPGTPGRPGFDGLDGADGSESVIPGPQGPIGPQGPTGPAGSGSGGGILMPYHEEYAPDDTPDPVVVPGIPGPQGPTGATGPTGPAGAGGGASMPYFPDSFIPDDSPDLLPLPGMALAAQVAAQAATVSWGTPTVLALDVDFTFASDGLVVLYNTVSQGGTFKINTVVIGGVASNQSSTCGFPYSSGQTGHIVSGGGSGLTAAFYPFTGGCGWGAPVSLTTSVNFTQTASGLVLIYNSGNQASTYVLAGTTYAETAVDANDSVGVPYIAGQTAQVTAGGAGAGLVAHYYPFTGNGAWGAAVSLSTGVNFTETASGLIVQYNSGNQGSTLTLNGAAVGGVFNTGHHAANNPYTVGQTANIGLVGGAGFLAWFFPLPSSTSGGGTVVTGGNFSTNVSTAVVGSPVVFADTSGKLGTTTVNRLQLTGSGNPQGVVAAALGCEYADTSTGYVYLKLGGASTAYGWYRIPFLGAGAAAGLIGWVTAVGPGSTNAFIGNSSGSLGVLTGTAVNSPAYLVSGGRTYAQAQTGAVSGNTSAVTTNSTSITKLLDDDIDVTCEFLTPADITNIRFWFGLSSASPTTDTDTLGSGSTGGALCFRYSTAAGDGGWVGYTAAGGGGSTHVSATILAIAASTAYKLRVRFVRAGTPTVYFSINDGTETAMTANLPATGGSQMVVLGVCTKANLLKVYSYRSIAATIGA
jgi:hypothetical protein